MENNEPLLKDKEDKITFLDDEPKKKVKKKSNKNLFPLIFTIILCILIGLFMYFKVVIPFYNGFKYFDLKYEKKENTTVLEDNGEDEISLSSIILLDTYAKIDITDNNELVSLYNIFYGNGITYNNLTVNQKLAIILANLGVTCDNQTIGANELSNTALNIFNDDTFISNSSIATDDFTMNYDYNTVTYNVSMNICSSDSNIVKTITKATTKDDDLYIYENVDDNGVSKDFKWTYKKGNNNNYYFYSIIPL